MRSADQLTSGIGGHGNLHDLSSAASESGSTAQVQSNPGSVLTRMMDARVRSIAMTVRVHFAVKLVK
jgi:hypothetical protein